MLLYLVKYGELSLKKGNKLSFIKCLVNNIKEKVNDINIKYDYARIYIEVKEENEEKLVKVLETTFGIHSFVKVTKVNKDVKEISDKAIELLDDYKDETFKVKCLRGDKSFPLTSIEIERKVGSEIIKAKGLKVDVHKPDIFVNLEIREDAYIYTKEEKGLGGFPVGIEGKALCLLSGGIDSPVAAYLSYKKGTLLDFIYFESLPHTSLEAREKVKELASEVMKYGKDAKLYIINFTKIQEEIYEKCKDNYQITILRRMMLKIASELASKTNSDVLITGESVGQVASQTLKGMVISEYNTNIPILRPLTSFDKSEIIEISKKIGTYDISIRPYPDCCTIFVPKHPVINPSINTALKEESKISNDLIEEAVNNYLTYEVKDYQKISELL